MSGNDMSGSDIRDSNMRDSGMNVNAPGTVPRRNQRLAGAVGLLLAGGLTGGVLAAMSPASAAVTTTSAAGVPAAAAPGGPADSGTPVRAGETALTGTNLATAKAAALKAVPGGAVYRVETDADGATYEAHMTKADGTRVTVKFDTNFNVTSTQDGMGLGGPGGHAGGTAPTSSGAAI